MTDEQAELAEANINLAYFMAQKLINHTPLEYEDTISTCFVGLCKAAMTFDPNKGIKFTTYATKIMQNQVFMANRTHKKSIQALHLEDLLQEEGLDWEAYVSSDQRLIDDYVTSGMVIESALKRILPKLSPKEKQVVALLFDNPELTQVQIGEIMGVSQVSAYRIKKRVRDRISRLLAI